MNVTQPFSASWCLPNGCQAVMKNKPPKKAWLAKTKCNVCALYTRYGGKGTLSAHISSWCRHAAGKTVTEKEHRIFTAAYILGLRPTRWTKLEEIQGLCLPLILLLYLWVPAKGSWPRSTFKGSTNVKHSTECPSDCPVCPCLPVTFTILWIQRPKLSYVCVCLCEPMRQIRKMNLCQSNTGS